MLAHLSRRNSLPLFTVVGLVGCAASADPFNFYDRRGVIDAVAIDSSGQRIALGGRNVGTGAYKAHGDVKLFDAKTGKQLHMLTAPAEVHDVALSDAGTSLALDYYWGDHLHVAAYQIPAGGPPVKVMDQDTGVGKLDTLCFVGPYLIMAGDGHLIVADATDWKKPYQYVTYQRGPAIDPFSRAIVIGREINGQTLIEWRKLDGSGYKTLPSAEWPLAFLSHGRLVTPPAEPTGLLMLRSGPEFTDTQPVPESNGQWAGGCASEDGEALLAWATDGTVKAWAMQPERAILMSTLSVPRIRYGTFTPVHDVVALVVDRKIILRSFPDGSSRATGTLAGGTALWSLSQRKRLYQFDNDMGLDILVKGSVAVLFYGGGEEGFAWDIGDPARPKLLWKDHWRNSLLSLVPLLE